ncbi:hypothetical protein BaRGS_00032551 [Batillaria attramentaria]|uniref:Uncharacterized protein n=1 Tax=Batillaria attramentaria TaxID=370345 RepID=A0ABD0JMM1_9CAEN
MLKSPSDALVDKSSVSCQVITTTPRSQTNHRVTKVMHRSSGHQRNVSDTHADVKPSGSSREPAGSSKESHDLQVIHKIIDSAST